jgi:hypothetical protein
MAYETLDIVGVVAGVTQVEVAVGLTLLAIVDKAHSKLSAVAIHLADVLIEQFLS